MTIKVLVVDDSALIRQILGEIIKSEPDMTLVGAAPDAFVAKKLVLEKAPDVITLDIEMPKVDGLRFLEVLMNAKPTPVVMISTLTEKGADATLRSLELGAIDFVAKPKIGVAQGMADYHEMIVEKIRTAARSKVRKLNPTKTADWIQRFRDNGELENEDPALLLLKQWLECKKYKDNPEKLAGLEQKVYVYRL